MKQIISEKNLLFKIVFFLISQNQNCLHALFSSEIFSYIMGMQTHFSLLYVEIWDQVYWTCIPPY